MHFLQCLYFGLSSRNRYYEFCKQRNSYGRSAMCTMFRLCSAMSNRNIKFRTFDKNNQPILDIIPASLVRLKEIIELLVVLDSPL